MYKGLKRGLVWSEKGFVIIIIIMGHNHARVQVFFFLWVLCWTRCQAASLLEVESLMQVKGGLIDPEGNLKGWSRSRDPCGWFGVICDQTSNVIMLILNFSGLSGVLVPQIANLTSLVLISFENNQISGQIPDSLGLLLNLRGIRLHDNHFSGPIPQSLANLADLIDLELFNNNLTGPIPRSGILATLNSSSFLPGNTGLCGTQIQRLCT